MKIADRLRAVNTFQATVNTAHLCDEAADALDAAEKALAAVIDAIGNKPTISVDEADRMARAALAKLRGEA